MKATTESATTGIFNKPKPGGVPAGVNLAGAMPGESPLEMSPEGTEALGQQARQLLIDEPEMKAELWRQIETRLLINEACKVVRSRWEARLLADRAEEAARRRELIIKSSHANFAGIDVKDADELFCFLTGPRIKAKLRQEVLAGEAGRTPTWQKDDGHSSASLEDYLRVHCDDFHRLALTGLGVTILSAKPTDLDTFAARFGLTNTLSWTNSDDGNEMRIYAGDASGFFPPLNRHIAGQRHHTLPVWKSVFILSGDDSCPLPWPGCSDCKWKINPAAFEKTAKPDALCELPSLPDSLTSILRTMATVTNVAFRENSLQMIISEGK